MKKRVFAAALAAALLLPLGGCSANSAVTEFFAMDTIMSVTAYGKHAKEAVSEAEKVIMSLDAGLSVTNSKSALYAYNSGAGDFISKDMEMIMLAADELYCITDGAFDIQIYPVVEAWGFFSGEYRVPGEEELRELLARSSMLDFGGIAKGYASDKAAAIMHKQGIQSALIVLGGNIYAIGSKPDGNPWRIAVQDPFDMSSYAGVLELENTAAVTSGAYQRFFELNGVTYHHIIDPRTGYPADSGLSSVTVVSENAALADGLSTGFFVLGKERALEIWRSYAGPDNFELILIENDGTITITGGLEGKFESENAVEIVK